MKEAFNDQERRVFVYLLKFVSAENLKVIADYWKCHRHPLTNAKILLEEEGWIVCERDSLRLNFNHPEYGIWFKQEAFRDVLTEDSKFFDAFFMGEKKSPREFILLQKEFIEKLKKHSKAKEMLNDRHLRNRLKTSTL